MSADCKSERAKSPAEQKPLELAAVREKLSAAVGKNYWRSLEEVAQTEGFQEMLHREFPRQASEWIDDVSRRNFLKVMGASLALAGLSACAKQPIEHILPYVKQPEEIIPGQWLWYATVMPMADRVVPVLVKSDMGRPIKIEGNADHPAGQLGTDIFAQASILDLYDPDRSQTILKNNEPSSWGDFLAAMNPAMMVQRSIGGAGLRLLTGTVSSPSLAAQITEILAANPQARWHKYEALNRDNAKKGAKLAFGQDVTVQTNLESADVILSLDADFLHAAGNANFLRDARAFSKRRKAEEGNTLNRLYVVESTSTTTGGKADHRLPLRAADVEGFARALASKLGVTAGGAGWAEGEAQSFLNAVAADLQAHKGKSIVLAGLNQSPAVHALAHAINDALGNAGKTVSYTDAVHFDPPNHVGDVESIRELAKDIADGKVDILVMIGSNPIYDAPADLGFDSEGKWLDNVKLRVHCGNFKDATALHCQWHIPASHYLESWSDARSADGTVSIVQPLIAPLYMSKTAHEVIGALGPKAGTNDHELLTGYWKTQHAGGDFDTWWRRSLHNGFMENSAMTPKPMAVKLAALPAAQAPGKDDLELNFRPDPTIFDGRFANNGWLQELPKPINTLTWDNPALISVKTAASWGIDTKGVNEAPLVTLKVNGRELKLAVWVTAGQPENAVTVYTGYGRTDVGNVGNDAGWNTYALRGTDNFWYGSGLKGSNSGDSQLLAAVHQHHNIENRGLVRVATVEEFEKAGYTAVLPEEEKDSRDVPSIFPLWDYSKKPEDKKMGNVLGYAWGMSIDMNSCIGCSTCVVACQAENNSPVVGRHEVIRGREMHWLRIDHYHEGNFENPKTHFQPLPCMQCENAPCEQVCPVAATTHSSEGLNDMVYNRCVGTRYCSNNCPYKVRRFNFLLYSDYDTPSLKLMRNPDVSVRSRGVMEKCTYCVQRINRARIASEESSEGKLIGDGPNDIQVATACQQACPADAIVFGNINDPNSRVSKLKAAKRNYVLVQELNTRPRTSYLATVVNPNPAIPQEKAGAFEVQRPE